MLANCLYEAGQLEAAEAEWEIVERAGNAEWAETVREARELFADRWKNR